MKNLERCKNHTQQRDVFPTAGQKQKEDPRCIATPGVSSLWVSAGQGSDTRRLSGRWLTFCYWSSREIVTLLSSTRVRCHIRRRTSHSRTRGSDAITGFPAPPAEQGPGTARVESFRSCPS